MFLSLTLGCDLANVVQWDVTIRTSGDGIEAILDTHKDSSCFDIIAESGSLGLVVTPRPGLLDFASADWIQVFEIRVGNWILATTQSLKNGLENACTGQQGASITAQGNCISYGVTHECDLCDKLYGICGC